MPAVPAGEHLQAGRLLKLLSLLRKAAPRNLGSRVDPRRSLLGGSRVASAGPKPTERVRGPRRPGWFRGERMCKRYSFASVALKFLKCSYAAGRQTKVQTSTATIQSQRRAGTEDNELWGINSLEIADENDNLMRRGVWEPSVPKDYDLRKKDPEGSGFSNTLFLIFCIATTSMGIPTAPLQASSRCSAYSPKR